MPLRANTGDLLTWTAAGIVVESACGNDRTITVADARDEFGACSFEVADTAMLA